MPNPFNIQTSPISPGITLVEAGAGMSGGGFRIVGEWPDV